MAYSVNYVVQEDRIGVQSISTISTTKNHLLGTIVRATDTGSAAYGSGEFIYLLGVASTVQGSWVSYNLDNGGTALLDSATSHIGPVGVAMAANVASSYGWYQISGKTVGKALAAFADNGLTWATTTPGSVDDAVNDGYMVHLAKGASALDTPATGFAEFEISRPYTDGIAGND